ncbi:MAG: DNA polymerase III subunit beta [Deltaproteobacteria bacterium]|nr:DNA polymerase III subunit beta [Deltaproteobacteria bacterium]
MEFRIQKSEFLRGLRLAQGIADRKSTMPILANVLLRTDGKGKLLLAATDLNVSVSAELQARVENEGGITASAKHLHEIVSTLPGEELLFRRAENHWADIRAGSVQYKLVGMPDRDFPKIPDHREVAFTRVEAGTLREMIDKTLFSVSNDETRFHLNGVLFECDGTIGRMVSTDGHRLSLVERSVAGGPSLAAGVIVPKKGLSEVRRLVDGMASSGVAEIAVSPPYFFARAGDIALAVKLIDSQFPPYDQVIPKSNDKVVVLERSVFLEALKRAQLMSSETRGVKLSITKGMLRVSSDNPELGEVKEDLEIDYAGEDLAVGLNPRYFSELLGQMATERIRLELSGELDPAVVRPAESSDYVGVVMPMRI